MDLANSDPHWLRGQKAGLPLVDWSALCLACQHFDGLQIDYAGGGVTGHHCQKKPGMHATSNYMNISARFNSTRFNRNFVFFFKINLEDYIPPKAGLYSSQYSLILYLYLQRILLLVGYPITICQNDLNLPLHAMWGTHFFFALSYLSILFCWQAVSSSIYQSIIQLQS